VTEPAINPDTGFPILFCVFQFPGVDLSAAATANITIDVLSRFLDKHRASAHSTTLIAQPPTTARSSPFPDKQKGVRIENGSLRSQTWLDIDDPDVREAHTASTLDRCQQISSFNRQRRRGFYRGLRQFSGWLRSTLAGDHVDAIDDFVGTLKKTIDDDGRHHWSTMVELFFFFFRLSPAVAVRSEKRVPAIAGDRKPQFRYSHASTVRYSGDHEAGIGGHRCCEHRSKSFLLICFHSMWSAS